MCELWEAAEVDFPQRRVVGDVPVLSGLLRVRGTTHPSSDSESGSESFWVSVGVMELNGGRGVVPVKAVRPVRTITKSSEVIPVTVPVAGSL